ncbi:MAG: S46 family peptidase [Chitinophagaceae bacterium]|nr:S46 family peptidase [Chitinophagaceae bacterium]
MREKRLSIMDADMAASEKTFIQYAAKQAGIANYYKKWKGELLGLQLNKAIDKKKNEETAFMQWVKSDENRNAMYGSVLDSLSRVYERQQPVIKQYEYLNEAIWASEVLKKGSVLVNLQKACDTLSSMDSVKKYRDELVQFLTTINLTTDEKITRELHAIYANDIQSNPFSSPEFIRNMYAQSMITHPELLMKYNNIKELKTALTKDPAYMAYVYYDGEQKKLLPALRGHQSRLTALYGQYMQALMAYKEGQAFYPDANSTLRVSYGMVEGIAPQDGMNYRYFTTLDGAVRKHNANVEEFNMPEKLLALHQAKDYGRYAIEVDGKPTVPLAFLASNHTTGGNSGSPVFNARGELIGTNFDRIWEGTMSDILYDINLCRNITLDIRYTLFIIEKFGGAKWVVDEMEVIE